MASSPSTLSQPNGLLFLPVVAKLARWRFKQMWRFLFVTWLGLLAMVILVCAGPLFTRIANSAYLRSSIRNAPDGSYITVDAISTHPTQEQLQQVEQQTNQAFQQGILGSYLRAAPQLIIQTPPFDMLVAGQTRAAAFAAAGYDNALAAQHTTVVQGRLPQVTTDDTVEIALSEDAASNLGLHVGSTMQGRYPISVGSQMWKFRVVGIVAPRMAHDAFWAIANPFSKSTVTLNSRYYFVNDGAPSYIVLAANDALKPKIAVLQTTFSGGSSFTDAFVLFWRYPFDLGHLDANDLPALAQRASELDYRLQDTLQRNITDLAYTNIFGTLFPALEFSSENISFVQSTVVFLLLVTLALALFLVILMSDVLVERQAAIIATLRSRGATRRHILGAFVAQGVVLGIVALLLGPLLAILLVRAIAPTLLSPDNQSAANVITTHPIQAAFDVREYAIIAVGVALVFSIIAVNRAMKMDIVSFRRESARPQRIPFWRRFYLDMFVAFLLIVGYIVYAYFWSFLALSASRVDPFIYKELTNVGFYVTPLIVVGVLLLFLRLFPHILRLVTYLVAKMRSAPSVLALAQMERTPRPAARIIVLLALAIAVSSFFLTVIASKEQRNIDVATFSAETADFSGTLPASDASKSFSQLQTYYRGLAGVQSATLGYHDVIQLDSLQGAASQGTITISAVDADTYARTALWQSSYSSQPLSLLTAQLVAHRTAATAHNVVYALVDAATWQRLHLTQGAQFSLPTDSSGNAHIQYTALARINYVPGVYDTPRYVWSGMGLLVDYQNYAVVKARATGVGALSPNYIWLRTKEDTASLASLRNALPTLNDRYTTITTIQNDPAHFSIIGVLSIAVGAALVLALLGTLFLSWLNASNRLTSFAVARALGMAPRQIAAVLFWEQGFVYIVALLLGLGLSALLMVFVPSAVALTDASGDWDRSFNVPAIQIVIPYSQLLFVLSMLALICLGALLLMARIVSRPGLSQTLRLNED